MSARSFRSVFMVASCAGAALGCYLVSLRVASERAALETVETRIVLAQRDIRLLQTEIGTRGRLAQLERWNVKVIALSAPTADQFLNNGFELARLTTPEREAPIDAPVILAAARTEQPPAEKPVSGAEATPSRRPADMVHLASLKTAPARKGEVSLEPRRQASPATVTKPTAQEAKPPTAERAKSSPQKTASKASALKAAAKVAKTQAASPKPVPAKTSTSAMAKISATAETSATAKKAPVRDPLAPLPESRTKVAAAKATRDPAKTR